MDARDLSLNQNAAVHSATVGGNPASATECTVPGLSDEQMRVRPRDDLNSLAWLMWHTARAEDIMVNPVLTGRSQVFDESWLWRLGIARRDFGIGMKSPRGLRADGADRPGRLREYRDAVGHRTREVVGAFQAQDWEGVAAAGMERAGTEGTFGARTEMLVKTFTGRPCAMVLSGIACSTPRGT